MKEVVRAPHLINKAELIAEIRANMASYDYYSSTYWHPEHGFMRLSRSHPYPCQEGEEELIPIPAQDPEGSGRLAELFWEDFLPSLEIPGVSSQEALEEIESTELVVGEAIDALEALQPGVANSLEDWLEEDAAWYADEWAEGISKGVVSADICSYDGPAVPIVLVPGDDDDDAK